MFLIDGYNAIRRVAPLAKAEERGGLEAGRNALVSAVLGSGVLRERSVVIVFDGSREALPTSPSPHPRLMLRYASAPQTADEAIVALVTSSREPELLVVVTADRELEWQVRALGAAVVHPERWEALKARARRTKRSAPGVDLSGKPTPSRREVDYWLQVFGQNEKGEK